MEIGELSEILERDITNDSYIRLVSYAQAIIDKKYLWLRRDKTIPEGKTAEDFVQETIMKFVEGERKWNPPQNTDTITYLKGHIKSVIYATFTKKEHKITSKSLSDTNDYDELLVDIEDGYPDILTIMELQEKIKEIYKLVEDDEGITEIIVCYEEGIYKRQDIADTLDISPDDVTARFKRLERRLRKINKE